MHHISAYIPCFNNANYIALAALSLRKQTIEPAEIFVVDDGSQDDSVNQAKAAGLRVIENKANLGRGAVRALAMQIASHELVLCVDGSKELASDFLEKAIPWFEDEKVAAVCGAMGRESSTYLDRWMERHLLDEPWRSDVTRQTFLATAGALVRKSAVMRIGNFNPAFRFREDLDLSDRLLAAGLDVVFDPQLKVRFLAVESLSSILDRDWRWKCKPGKIGWRTYFSHIEEALNVRLPRDLSAKDLPACLITLISPHFRFIRSRLPY